VKALQAKNNKRRYKELRAFLTIYKLLSGCVDCGYRENADALEFDHVQPKSRLMMSTGSVSASLKELRKCEVRCANCHRIVTQQRRLEVQA
jgi:hypothetical protein